MPQRRDRSYKEEPSRNYRAQKYNNLNKKKTCWMKLTVEWGMALPRIHEVEEKSMECIQSE